MLTDKTRVYCRTSTRCCADGHPHAGHDDVEATRRIHESWSDARVIILTTFNDDTYVFGAFRGGALIGASAARKVVTEFARPIPPARVINNICLSR